MEIKKSVGNGAGARKSVFKLGVGPGAAGVSWGVLDLGIGRRE